MTQRKTIVVLGTLACLVPMLAAQAQTVTNTLLSDTFAAGTIANPPYTTTTAGGGTISASPGALHIGLTSTAGDAAYIATRDNISAQYIMADTATLHFTADVDFTNLVFTAQQSGVNNGEGFDLFRVLPLVFDRLVTNNPVVEVSVAYNDWDQAYYIGVSNSIEYNSGGSAAFKIAPTTFAAHSLMHFDLRTTITDNSSLNRNWTIASTLTVTSGAITLGTASGSGTNYTAAYGDTFYNPIQHDNIVAIGNFLHSRSDANIELSGGYTITQFSDAVSFLGPSGAPTSPGTSSPGNTPGSTPGSIPEPAALGLILLGGGGLLTRRTVRCGSRR